MAVYKSLIKEDVNAFIAETAKLRVDTLRILKKFPTSYRYLITNSMMTIINDAYTNILKGNSLFISDAMLEDDFKLGHIKNKFKCTLKVIKNSNNNWVYIPIKKKENLVA